MGWKGTLRSVNSTLNAMERDAQRRRRELERQRQQVAKMEELERARYEVEVHQNEIDMLLSIHHESAGSVPWKDLADAPEPKEPEHSQVAEQAARQALETYQPGRLDKMLNRGESKRQALEKNIETARQQDAEQYQRARTDYERERADWKESRDLARRVLSGDPEAYGEALRKVDAFRDVSQLGGSLTFELNEGGPVEATLDVHGEQAIPKQTLSLLKSGKLSVKDMPKTKFYELYQDYVCGAVLRVANDVFAVLPTDGVIVTAVDRLLNTKTGHIESQPILSVAIPRQTLKALNLKSLDPSDAMANFVHNMNLKKTQGFAPVERILPTDIQMN